MMKDGFIQQIATPQQVFGQPANLFVAGFMGTPQMNCFRNASVVEKDGKSVAEAAGPRSKCRRTSSLYSARQMLHVVPVLATVDLPDEHQLGFAYGNKVNYIFVST